MGEIPHPRPGMLWYPAAVHVHGGPALANSKTLSVQRKHRRRQRAAKERVRQHLDGKLDAERLPMLARAYLVRRLRVAKRG